MNQQIDPPSSSAARPVPDAQQSIAQSSALAMADATDNLRNLSTLSTTAIGVALSNFIETGDPRYGEMIDQAQGVVKTGVDNFSAVGQQVSSLFKE